MFSANKVIEKDGSILDRGRERKKRRQWKRKIILIVILVIDANCGGVGQGYRRLSLSTSRLFCLKFQPQICVIFVNKRNKVEFYGNTQLGKLFGVSLD